MASLSPQSATPTGISNTKRVVGFFTPQTGPITSFLLNLRTRHVTPLAVPAADATVALGVNDHGEVVGSYTMGATTFGFTWTATGGFQTLTEPNAVGSTQISGVNNAGDLVGSYTDSRGRTHGFLATRNWAPVNPALS